MNIRFPSIKEIGTQSVLTFKRFPFVLLSALLGSLAAMWLVSNEGNTESSPFWYVANLCWVSFLGISVFLAAATYTESKGWDIKRSLWLKGGVLIVLAIYYFTLPEQFTPDESEAFFRFLLFALGGHLLVSFLPFLDRKEQLDFWAYNKTLLLQFLRSALYSAALYIGLIIALFSLDILLEIEIDSERYLQLWIGIVGIFNTWLFLSGVPDPNNLTAEERAYPGGLKVFVQYILLPLITVYICILYLYTGKIILEWAWPNGWVANLVLSFSIAGILALLLLYPIRQEAKNRWIQHFSRFYYIALIPLVVLLLLSIWVRISEYGVTVNRYFVATLGVWLTGMVIYSIIRKEHNIKVIPVSLCVIALLISFGPLGAFEVSKRSQLNRLEMLLAKNDLLSEEGKILQVSDPDSISFEDQKQISSSIRYVVRLKGEEVLQPYFEQDLNKVMDQGDSVVVRNFETQRIMELMGLDFIPDWRQPGGISMESKNISYNLPGDLALPIEGYGYYIGEYTFSQSYRELSVQAGEHEWKLSFDINSKELSVAAKELETVLKLSVQPLMEEVLRRSKASTLDDSAKLMMVEEANQSVKVKAILKQMNMAQNEEEPELNLIRMVLLIGENETN